MNVRKGIIAGLGVAGLLVALPVQAGGGKSSASGTTSSGSGSSASGSMGSGSGSGSMGSGGMHSGTASAAGQNEITGKVEKFDESSNELTLSLKVSDKTQVTKDGKTASLSDIEEGDQVRASFTGSGENLQVTRIEVMSEGAKSGASPSGSGMGSGGSGAAPGSSGTSGSGSSGSSGRGY